MMEISDIDNEKSIRSHNNSGRERMDSDREEKKRVKSKKQSNKNNEPDKYRWVKYMIYIWLFRLGMQGISIVFPLVWVAMSYSGGLNSPLIFMDEIQSIIWSNDGLIRRLNRHEIISPLIVKQVPLQNKHSLEDMVFLTVKHLSRSTTVKVSNTSEFTYFSSNRAWSKLYNDLKNYNVTSYEDIDRFSDSNSEIQVVEKANHYKYWYISQPIPLSMKSAWLQRVSPSYQKFIKDYENKLSDEANVLLWMASAGSTASFHYDMELNFFLQLSGSKTFIIAPPSAQSILQPLSSLHPHWRQATNKKGLRNEMFRSVTLRPGEMLIIPPFYFHQVVSGKNSSSVNAWFISSASKSYANLVKSAPLPYSSSDSLEIKLSCLGTLLSKSLKWENADELKSIALSRYNAPTKLKNNGIPESSQTCSQGCPEDSNPEPKLCNDFTLSMVYNRDLVDAAVSHLNEHMDIFKGSKYGNSIKFLLLMDFIEEHLTIVAQDTLQELSPDFLVRFIQDCFTIN